MSYEYRMVQIPPTIALSGREKGGEAAAYLAKVANEQAQQGWEFYRVDQLGVAEPQGCLSTGGPQMRMYYVVTFRRPARGAGQA